MAAWRALIARWITSHLLSLLAQQNESPHDLPCMLILATAEFEWNAVATFYAVEPSLLRYG